MLTWRKVEKTVFGVLLISVLLFSGCANFLNPVPDSTALTNSKSENSDSTVEIESEPSFQPYEIQVANTNLDIFSGPGYSFSVVGKISSEDTYVIVEEQTDDYGTVWGRIESKKGWIDIDLAQEKPIEEVTMSSGTNTTNLEELVLEGNQRYYTKDDLKDKTEYELSILRNGLYALSGKIFVKNQEVKDFFENCTWYKGDTEDDSIVKSRFNQYQEANLKMILEVEKNLISDGEQITPQGSTGADSIADNNFNYQEQASNGSVPLSPSGDAGNNSTGSTDEVQDDVALNVVSQEIKGVEFNYVNPFKYTAKYTGDVIDYDINLEIKYCEPSDYEVIRQDNSIDTIIYNSGENDMYYPEEIKDAYNIYGDNDYAIFEISIKGKYNDEFAGWKNIEFRKYTAAGALLKDIATGITDHELLYMGEGEDGTINGKCYIGFCRSEVARVDIRILGVGPREGIGGW